VKTVLPTILVALLLSGCGNANSASVPESGNDRIDALSSDIVAGNREDAIAKIDEIQSISGAPLQIANPSEFVDALKGCTVSSYHNNVSTASHEFVITEWNCPSGKVETLLGTLPHHSKVTIGNIEAK
jgi:hypothetical protein